MSGCGQGLAGDVDADGCRGHGVVRTFKELGLMVAVAHPRAGGGRWTVGHRLTIKSSNQSALSVYSF